MEGWLRRWNPVEFVRLEEFPVGNKINIENMEINIKWIIIFWWHWTQFFSMSPLLYSGGALFWPMLPNKSCQVKKSVSSMSAFLQTKVILFYVYKCQWDIGFLRFSLFPAHKVAFHWLFILTFKYLKYKNRFKLLYFWLLFLLFIFFRIGVIGLVLISGFNCLID